jgi:integrase
LEASTLESYERYLRLHVLPAIGGIRLQQLDGARLNALYADLLDRGRKDGRGGLKARTVRYIHTIAHAVLKDAVRWGRVLTNAADRADPPSSKSAKPPEMRTWARDELAKFLEATSSHRLHPAFVTLATTGMRRGEALGLRWSDVDLDAGRTSIRQQVVCVAHEVIITPRTKTGRARQIELDSTTLRALRAWRKRQIEERMLLALGRHEGLIFSRPDGEPLHPERFSRTFEREAAKAGLPRIRLHDLRHTWATLALEAGVAPKVVSERLGHSSISITLDVYSHVTPAMQSGAAEEVARLIFGKRL